MVTHHVDSTQGIPGEEWVLHNAEVGWQWHPHSFVHFSVLWHTAVYMCPVKWIYGLYYLVVTKLTVTKWSSGLKRFLKKTLQVEVNTNNTSTNKQESCRADTSAPSTSPSSTTLHGSINDNLIKFDKKLAKKIQNYQDNYLKYKFTSSITNNEVQFKHILCL